MHALRRFVVATDFSPTADAALRFAASIYPIGITLVHVCEPTAEHGDPAGDDDIVEGCRVALAETCARFADCGVDITPILRSGNAADKIHNVATEVGASLIVIGRGASLGHIAERVLRQSTRPVLTVGCDPLATKELP